MIFRGIIPDLEGDLFSVMLQCHFVINPIIKMCNKYATIMIIGKSIEVIIESTRVNNVKKLSMLRKFGK